MTGARGRPAVGARDRGSPHTGLRRATTECGVLEALAGEVGPLTRAELARRTGISAPSVGAAVRRLVADGVLAGVGPASGRAGAVATLYEVAPGAGAVVAVESGPAGLRADVADLVGRTVHRRERAARGPLPARLDTLLDDLCRRQLADGCPVRAVAVSVIDPVDTAGVGAPLVGDVPGLAGTDIMVDRGVVFAARAERRYGVATEVESFAYLHVGEGGSLGLALMVGDRVLHGARRLAGAIGHLAVGDSEGRHRLARTVAACGLRAGPDDRLPVPDVERAAQVLGEAVAAVCAVVDPELVVVGGPVGERSDLCAGIGATVEALAVFPVPVVGSALGETASLRGALLDARSRAWDGLIAARG